MFEGHLHISGVVAHGLPLRLDSTPSRTEPSKITIVNLTVKCAYLQMINHLVIIALFHVEMRSESKSSANSRVKREERILDNGCLSHTTAVAAGALAMYVRYIAEYQQTIFERGQIFTTQS